MNVLPLELVSHVFSFLNHTQRVLYRIVCKAFNSTSDIRDTILYRIQRYIKNSLYMNSRCRYKYCTEKVISIIEYRSHMYYRCNKHSINKEPINRYTVVEGTFIMVRRILSSMYNIPEEKIDTLYHDDKMELRMNLYMKYLEKKGLTKYDIEYTYYMVHIDD